MAGNFNGHVTLKENGPSSSGKWLGTGGNTELSGRHPWLDNCS